MRLVPRRTSGHIQFYESHLPRWAEDPEAIGTTPGRLAAVEAAVTAAREAVSAQARAASRARSATLRLKLAMRTLAGEGRGVILQIRARAEASGTDGEAVYARAGIAAPASASKAARPGNPYDFAVALDAVGRVTLSWKRDNPRGTSGTMYEVYRQTYLPPPLPPPLPEAGPGVKAFLAVVGVKRFVDDTIPADATQLTYTVRAVRGGQAGPVGLFNVTFGGSPACGAPGSLNADPNRPARDAA